MCCIFVGYQELLCKFMNWIISCFNKSCQTVAEKKFIESKNGAKFIAI